MVHLKNRMPSSLSNVADRFWGSWNRRTTRRHAFLRQTLGSVYDMRLPANSTHTPPRRPALHPSAITAPSRHSPQRPLDVTLLRGQLRSGRRYCTRSRTPSARSSHTPAVRRRSPPPLHRNAHGHGHTLQISRNISRCPLQFAFTKWEESN
ncbi:uncharacterized protein LY79DRAFT_371756 [Colletotrichum navitas]|uniref:Uncharacterized protein n=1 Tax=Colletotrichum navitas TaxID=681940 RepID=A0AAD8V1D4_9PEZI|nr:uncharacterized protein LY79DRAFT_371756 [Colletotrichum navitas]KAK1574260.1 hypothetical protein LY79DRAFT_371756 [Colletotrichum navitas]